MSTAQKYLDLIAKFKGVHIASATQFTRDDVLSLLQVAKEIKELDEHTSTSSADDKAKKQQQQLLLQTTLQGKVLVPLFYENSTRTFASFCAAMQKLGGSVLPLQLESSSISKGETLSDTVRCVDCYADVIAFRHPKVEALEIACSVAKRAPIMNGGNGSGQHPTQALLDAFTIQQELGTLDGLTIALLGDLRHGRTVHSLARLLALFSVKKMFLISPPALQMPDDVIAYLKERNVSVEAVAAPTPEVMRQLNVLYVTRIQKERFADPVEYEALKGSYVIDKKLMEHAAPPVAVSADTKEKKNTMILMHPLPRVDEISTDVDDDPRAAYFRQMRYGMHLRMALLLVSLGKPEFGQVFSS